MNGLLVGALVLVGVVALWGVLAYNKLVVLRQRIAESWSNVDTELKRRHDLIPNLVEAVKGYASHERAIFEEVARERAAAMGDPADSSARQASERALVAGVARVMAVAEDYPKLKADASFLRLQRELVDTEDRIQAARRFYNGNVRDYNNAVETFPSSLVAGRFRFATRGMFDLPILSDRDAPAVRLG